MGSLYFAQAGLSWASALPVQARAASESAIAARWAMPSAPERGAGLLPHLGHYFGHHGGNFGLGQGAFARLQGHMNGDRLHALGYAFATVDVEHADPGD